MSIKRAVRLHIGPPAVDESISSVLDRAANLYSLCRTTLLGQIMGARAAPRDYDCLVNRSFIEPLASAMDVPAEDIEALACVRSQPPVLIGDRQRDAYCPLCFDESCREGRAPYFRLSWASMFVTFCSEHRTPLFHWKWVTAEGRRSFPEGFYHRGGDLPRWYAADLRQATNWRNRTVCEEALHLFDETVRLETEWSSEGLGNLKATVSGEIANKEAHVKQLILGFLGEKGYPPVCLGHKVDVPADATEVFGIDFRRVRRWDSTQPIRQLPKILTHLPTRRIITLLVGWAFGEVAIPRRRALKEWLPAASSEAGRDLAYSFFPSVAFREALAAAAGETQYTQGKSYEHSDSNNAARYRMARQRAAAWRAWTAGRAGEAS